MKPFFTSVLLLFCVFTNAQIITRIAGNGTAGYSGNGGLATSAQLAFPRDVVTDNAGNLYIADEYNNVIRKVNSAGIISTVAGTGVVAYSGDGGLAVNATLYHPWGLAIDNSNNIYFIDQIGHLIRKIDNNAIITTITGNLPVGYTGNGGPLMGARFGEITGITFDNLGNMYIADGGNYVIRKVNSAGIISTIAGNQSTGFSGDGSLATSAQLGTTYAVAFDNAGNMYIPDPQNRRIRKVSTTGIITTFAGTGALGYSGDGGAAVLANLNNPWDIDIDNAGNLFIADESNFVVRKVDNSGIITTVAGNGLYGNIGDGGPGTSASLGYNCVVHVDANNNLLICVREFFHVVRKLTLCQSGNVIITQQPQNVSLCNSGNANFSTTATNLSGYQWQEKVGTSWNNISNNATYSGATTNTLNITGVTTSFNNYQYRCVLTNSCGNAFTNPATLSVTAPNTPTINITTAATAICQGSTTTFTANTTNEGTTPLYQWKKNGINVGSNSNIYNVNTLVNGDIISCLLTSNATCLSSATASSNNIVMTVNAPVAATILINTGSNNICSGTTITFNTTATNEGTSPIYQWKNNGISVGANSSSYSTNVLNNGDIISCTLTSNQSCLVSNTVNSNNITMVVNPSFTPTITITANTNNVCAGTPITFNASTTNSGTSQIYQWKKNGLNVGTSNFSYTDNTLTSSDNISCSLSVSGSGCFTANVVSSNSIQSTILQPALPTVVISAAKTSICEGTSVSFLSVGMNTTATTNYQWLKNGFAVGNNTTAYTDNNIVNGDVIKLNISTTNNSNCIAATTVGSNIITMTVFADPIVTLDHSNTICDGGNRLLDAGSYTSYLWNTGSIQRTLNVTAIGTYYVAVLDINGCIGSDTSKITSLLPKPFAFLPKDTSICTYGSVLIIAKSGYKNYVWSDFSTKPTLSVINPGTYELTVTDNNNCKATEDITVIKKEGCLKGFYIPSAFSPNNDNRNDFFKPIIYGSLKKYRFSIYSRYGQTIFETTDSNKGWDGKLYGEISNTSGYIWICNYQFEGEVEVEKKGTFVLIR